MLRQGRGFHVDFFCVRINKTSCSSKFHAGSMISARILVNVLVANQIVAAPSNGINDYLWPVEYIPDELRIRRRHHYHERKLE
jgi:hypothetical protein